MATVRRCIDCDVALVDETRPGGAQGEEPAGSTAAPLGDGDQVGYELEGWGNQLKVTLEGMLDRAGINRAWEAGALVVAASDEASVDDLIATLEGGEVQELDEDEPQVALEIEGLDADAADDLDARLIAGAVAHAWGEDGALLVREADEERVLALIDEVFEADPDADDGFAAQQARSDLFVAVDRLAKDPHDRKLAAAYRAAAENFGDLPVPYGLERTAWASLVADVADLADRMAPWAFEVSDDQSTPADEVGDDQAGSVDEDDDSASGEGADTEEPSGPAVGAELADDAPSAEEAALKRDRDDARALRLALLDLV